MALMKISLLSQPEIARLHEASLTVLERVGVHAPHSEVLRLFAEAGAVVDPREQRVQIPRALVQQCLETAGKQFTIYGRDRSQTAAFGLGSRNYNTSAGQALWVEDDGARR